MVLEPQLPDVIVELLLLELERSTVVVWAVVVAEGNEDRLVGKVLGEELLDLLVVTHEHVVVRVVLVVLLLGNAVRDHISVVSDEIDVIPMLSESLQHHFNSDLGRIATNSAKRRNRVRS